MPLHTHDIVAVQQIAARYNHALDAGDGDAFAALFLSDGELDTGDIIIKGRARLAEFARSVGERPDHIRHVLTDVLVDGDEKTAYLRAYLRVTVRSDSSGPRTEVSSGSYHCRLEKVDGEWRFAKRTYAAD
ncbi:nuclear transport factor 2 family protein [Pseudonocardia oroxyli]|uniref:nuclear transport factor 2 family protein n=1 Tax=Pseudonocardia oroxyli TaxID=366584 RepID=UPI00159FFD74|nr:nuclear transport factor 2 family protein [Pseudonocardia oroxyli]